MSSKVYTPSQLLWFKAVHLTIVEITEEKILSCTEGTVVHQHLRWRLACNLYNATKYKEAMPILEEIARIEDILFSDDANITSVVHQTVGRCAVQLFRETLQHTYLEQAYVYYQTAVQTMVMNLYTMFKLPQLLLEFGRVLEDYGAFEAANDLYGRILSGFPNFRGYFDALYRSAIVGRHLASLHTEPAAKEEALNKCLDVLQFLLEALPATITDYHIVLLYGRTLELSSNPQTKFRAHSVYRSLFELCQRHVIAGAHKGKEAAEWLEDPTSWFRLGEEIAAAGESIVAKDAYHKFMELKERQALMSFRFDAKDVAAHLDVATCVKLALGAARYQNYEEAVRYAEIGLRVDRYDKTLRQYLAQWSALHAEQLRGEVVAINSILSVWKGRCWTNGFRRKLKQKMIADCEERYAQNRFDWEARENLAYYAREKYRPKFVFEEHCAVRIQRWARQCKKQRVWTEAQRQHVFTQASEVLRRYQRFPLSHEVRDTLVAISKHRLVPAGHAIHAARREIEVQNKAVRLLENAMHTHRLRRAITRKINETRQRRAKRLFVAARTIQCAARIMLAIMRVERLLAHRELMIHSATVLQRWMRRYYNSFYMTALRVRHLEFYRRRKALAFLKNRLPSMVKSFLFLRKVRQQMRIQREEEEARQAYRDQLRAKFERAVVLIQRFQRLRRRKILSKLSRQAVMRRKLAELSLGATDLVAACAKDPISHYQIPGINQRAASFIRATQQKTIYCSGKLGFSAADCLMLSMVLRSTACAVRTLVLHHLTDVGNPCYEFDLLNALRKCTSIRAVHVLGGDWEQSFLSALIEIAHVENPRITTLVIEQVPRAPLYAGPLSDSAGRLLMDYFNYSIPGMIELTLHGCGLNDANVDLISQGVAVNSSIRHLTLSLNMIEDAGFVKIFKAFCGNKKSKIEKLDFSYNLIQSTWEVKRLLLAYTPHSLNVLLTIYFMHNRIYEYYHPVNDFRNRGLSASFMTIIYTEDDLLMMKHPNFLVSARKTHATFDPPPPTDKVSTAVTVTGAGDSAKSNRSVPRVFPPSPANAAVGPGKLRLLKKMQAMPASISNSSLLSESALSTSSSGSLHGSSSRSGAAQLPSTGYLNHTVSGGVHHAQPLKPSSIETGYGVNKKAGLARTVTFA